MKPRDCWNASKLGTECYGRTVFDAIGPHWLGRCGGPEASLEVEEVGAG